MTSPWKNTQGLRFGKKKRWRPKKDEDKERARLKAEYLKRHGVTKIAAAFAHFE